MPKFFGSIAGKFPSGFSVGRGTWISESCNIDVTGCVMIGNNCSIGHDVKIWTHKHPLLANRKFDIDEAAKEITVEYIEIGDYVTIFDNALIMPGVNFINSGCTILTGCVLTKHTTNEGEMWGGNPGRFIKNAPR